MRHKARTQTTGMNKTQSVMEALRSLCLLGDHVQDVAEALGAALAPGLLAPASAESLPQYMKPAIVVDLSKLSRTATRKGDQT